MKAFLSHSSNDKEFVERVAVELGRQFCVYDAYSFSTGVDFKRSIEQGLDESSVFVLFASSAALRSVWVDFEASEAWYHRLQEKIPSALVYLIDSSLSVSDLPQWLARVRVRSDNAPLPIARDIRRHLDDMLRARQGAWFVGRTADIDRFERLMTPVDGTAAPRSLVVHGLPGIGRRSLVRRVSPSLLNLRGFLQIRMGEGDTIHDLCAIVADRIEPHSTRQGLQRLLYDVQALSEEEALERILRNLRKATLAGELPLLLDEGGVISSDGFLTEPVRSVLSAMAPDDDLYLVLILHRRPQDEASTLPPVLHLNPLAPEETTRLLTLLAARDRQPLSPEQVRELADYIGGYPPAAYFVIHQVKEYGVDLVMRDKRRLVDFQSSVFLRHFATVGLSQQDQEILRLMAFHSPLPLKAIVEVCGVALDDLTDVLIRLIDYSLIVVDEMGLYRIADPIAAAASRTFGLPEHSQHAAVAASLLAHLSAAAAEFPHLELSRVLFRAAKLAGDHGIAAQANHLASDLVRLTESLYHSRRYTESVALGYSAIEQRPASVKARSYLVRALIQEERWPDAERQLRELERFAPAADVLFLRGFLERKRSHISAAIDALEQAQRLGRRGAALKRELAQCYLLDGNLDAASKYIQEALGAHGANPYVVDIAAKIAMEQGDEQAARDMVAKLELLRLSFYWHRLSTVELCFGDPQKAERASEEAIASEDSPPFHFRAQLVNCKIKLNKLDEAAELLADTDRQFAQKYVDVRLSLKCRIEIARGHYSRALQLSKSFQDKRTLLYKTVRRKALGGELASSGLRDDLRATYSKEAALLDGDLLPGSGYQVTGIE